MAKQHYIEIPVLDYNALPILELNTVEDPHEIEAMRLLVSGLRKYADYIEGRLKEREEEIIDNMYLNSVMVCETEHRTKADFTECLTCNNPDCRLLGLTSDEAEDMRVRANEE